MKTNFEQFLTKAKELSTTVCHKVDYVKDIAKLKLEIYSTKKNIKEQKLRIANLVLLDEEKFKEFPEIVDCIELITSFEEKIADLNEKICDMKKDEDSKKI